MRKKATVLFALMLLALLAVGVFGKVFLQAPEKKAMQYVERNGKAFADLVDCGRGAPSTWDGKRVDVWDAKHPMYEFLLDTGIGDTQYYGVYYSPDDVPLAFQNADAALSSDDSISWTWQAEGDNHGMTRRIAPMWYYFEAAF